MSRPSTCPHCGHTTIRRTNEEVWRSFEANQFYYEVGHGIAWAPPRVVFENDKSARQFKDKYPEFNVFSFSGNQHTEVN